MPNCHRPKRYPGRAAITGWLRRFAREDDGAILILSLQIFIIMLVTTGIAIDFVRQEERRTLIQNTIDRAVLAAASLDQKVDPKVVVKDYLAKAGLSYLKVEPDVKQSDTAAGQSVAWRSVSVSVVDEMPTLFGPLLGIDSLTAKGGSQAKESVGNVEISLVLDISGSMRSRSGSSTRIELLSTAAKNFVTKLFDTVQAPGMPDGRLSISIVPYNHNVVLGVDLSSVLNVSNDHNKNTCVDVEPLGWDTTDISNVTHLLRTHYGDNSNDNFSGLSSKYSVDLAGNATKGSGCKENSDAAIMAFSTNAQILRDKIDDVELSVGGNTSIDIGARWGLALLDPAFQPATNALVFEKKLPTIVENRPMPFDTGGIAIEKTALKIMVLMTDGENTEYYSLKEPYRVGPSGLYSSKSSTYINSRTNRWGSITPEWKQLFYYESSRAKPWYSFYYDTWYTETDVKSKFGTVPSYAIEWKTLWEYKRYPLQYAIQEFLQYPYADIYNISNSSELKNTLYEEMGIQGEDEQKDRNLRSICAVAKDKDHGITIYTVAMVDGLSSPSVLNDCATDSLHAYNVKSADLSNAFAGIAASITALRLTN